MSLALHSPVFIVLLPLSASLLVWHSAGFTESLEPMSFSLLFLEHSSVHLSR